MVGKRLMYQTLTGKDAAQIPAMPEEPRNQPPPGSLPKEQRWTISLLDLATGRRKESAEAIVETVNEGRMGVKLIAAQSVFDEEYPPGSKKRAEFQNEYLEHVRKQRRVSESRPPGPCRSDTRWSPSSASSRP